MVLMLFVIMLILILFGMDIALAMGVSGLVYLIGLGLGDNPIPLTLIPQQLMEGANSFSLTAVPLFILAGEIMNRGGITLKLVAFAQSLVGHLRGGLAHTSVVVNMIMAGMSGSAVADCTATGSILVPAMKEAKYGAKFSAAIIASASTIGPVIPPSIPMVLIGAIAGVSVGRLFIGGAIPGTIMGLSLMAYIWLISRRRSFPRDRRATIREILISTRDALIPLGLPVVIIGSILTGAATPTEAAVVGVIYASVITIFIYRTVKWKDLVDISLDASVVSATIMFLCSTGILFGWVATSEQLGLHLSNYLLKVTNSPIGMFLIINLILLIMGCFLEGIPIILLMTPILYPIVRQIGIDPIHFGVVMTVNIMIGLLTPPIGLHLFITSAIAKVSIGDVVTEVWPMVIVLTIVLLLLTFFPPLVTWLPGILMR
jgi:tripartite ATP-independent transporter DctM subunit